MTQPTFKTIRNGLTRSDFEEFPIWVWSLIEDANEPWHHEIGEHSYRGYQPEYPLRNPLLGLYLAIAKLPNNLQVPGYARWHGDRFELQVLFPDSRERLLLIHKSGTDLYGDINYLERLANTTLQNIFPLQFKFPNGIFSIERKGVRNSIENFVLDENQEFLRVEKHPENAV